MVDLRQLLDNSLLSEEYVIEQRKKIILPGSITISGNEIFLIKDETLQLHLEQVPKDSWGYHSDVILWDSSEPDIVEITDTGYVIGLGFGVSTIHMVTPDGKYRNQIKIKVDEIVPKDFMPESVAKQID